MRLIEDINSRVAQLLKRTPYSRTCRRGYFGWPFFIGAIILLAVEILIAFDYFNRFTRVYIGDMLVVILLYMVIYSFIPRKGPWLPLAIFIFAVFVEVTQYFDLAEALGAEPGGWLWVVLGSTFDWMDILMYGIGCIILLGIDRIAALPVWARIKETYWCKGYDT